MASVGGSGGGVQNLRRSAAHGDDKGGAVHLHALGKVLTPVTGDNEGGGHLLMPAGAGRGRASPAFVRCILTSDFLYRFFSSREKK